MLKVSLKFEKDYSETVYLGRVPRSQILNRFPGQAIRILLYKTKRGNQANTATPIQYLFL